MSSFEIHSEAFQRASCVASGFESSVLLYVIAVLAVVVVARAVLEEADMVRESLVLLVGMAAYEGLMLRGVTRAIRAEWRVGFRVWI